MLSLLKILDFAPEMPGLYGINAGSMGSKRLMFRTQTPGVKKNKIRGRLLIFLFFTVKLAIVFK